MKIYCLEDFKVEFEKLKSKKSYRTLESEVIDYFFDKSIKELLSGTRLNHSIDIPYIKKRLGGRGGFRTYFLLIIKDDSLYLMYVHPKTGVHGADNIDNKLKASIYKKVLESIQSKDLYELTIDESKSNITFKKLSIEEVKN